MKLLRESKNIDFFLTQRTQRIRRVHKAGGRFLDPFNTESVNMENKVTNLTYLREVADGSEEFVLLMINKFMEKLPADLDKLEQALKAKDWILMNAICHKIKQSYIFMGIQYCEEMALSIEKDALAELNLDKMQGLVSNIRKVSEDAFKELKDEIAGLAT